ncbi:Carbamoyl-phosphate synthase [Microsporum canis]
MPAVPSSPEPKAPKNLEIPVREPAFPSSPSSGGIVAYNELQGSRTILNGAMFSPASVQLGSNNGRSVCLELEDGTLYKGFNFGAERSIAGELVFQTGMVGYPESLTDPSYRGQILVITFPLVGNYGVPSRDKMDGLLKDLPKHFESNQIHVAGLVVASYCGEAYSHFLAESSLGEWLKEQNVPAIYGVDTRALTKRIREKGSMLGRILLQKKTHAAQSDAIEQQLENWRETYEEVEWEDPNKRNLVDDVSIKEPKLYTPPGKPLLHPSGRPVRILCIDVGLKYNQLRCLLSRNVEVLVVPWNYDFPRLAGTEYDGLFLSNGPGDPATLTSTVAHLKVAIRENKTPIFGICLGHQLLARAAGASTLKMKFGNRGHNIPCTSMLSGRCYITSQNHGYAVDSKTLPEGWEELFVNANDSSNEGIRHASRPLFSVQFHPESTPGPRDTEFLFDVFINTVRECLGSKDALNKPVSFPGGTIEENIAAHPRVHVKKVLILGSGGLSIGQAGEFDYSGSQAIKALNEEGIYTVLINPNIATIQTSKGLADKVYFLPVNADFVRKVIKRERPDAIYVTFGGQTALQVGIQLKDEFEELGVQVLGTPIDTIITTEDRELFARSMEAIGEKCAKSASASNLEEAMEAVKNIGFPVIVRAAYALGGLGSGFAESNEQLRNLCTKAFAASPQVLIERSMKGWKEIEYEVVRDARDNCITVCNMENFDPLGIHTGDSIVVAPSQTLSDEDYNMLRTTAVNVIRHLGVVGECNIQYALNPFSREYCIIEVNARLSRSSALASKATGYPLAFIAAKLGLGIPLNEISNSVTKVTCACFEPSLDYVVVKIPRWDLKKFTRVSTQLGSSMKSVGEVMSIGRTFEEAIQKAIRAIDFHNLGFNETSALMSIKNELQTPSDQRLFAIANAMHSGYTVDEIWELTKIDKWFLRKLEGLSQFGKQMSNYTATTVPVPLIMQAKQLGFSDRQLARFLSSNELAVRRIRVEAGIVPFVKQIDTVAAEFPAFTNYLYLTYNGSENDVTFDDQGIMVLGSGVYRIGSSVEFDWCSVRTIRTLREQGYKTVMVNYNPETVSTDYDEADRLYFENITLETVLDIYQLESSSGVAISMGGQTPNNIALPLHRLNVKILGTSPEMIDTAENRYKFSRMLDRIGVDQPAWKELTSIEEATAFCDKVGYPVLVRPSYVLSGAAMNTVYSQDDLANYLDQAAEVSREHPVVITKYIENAKEIEMDAVAKNGVMCGHFISEHVENAGVHSGDATLIVPPQDLDPETVRRIEEATSKIGNALNVTGPFNIQFIAKDNEIKVIECNVRASRSFPFVSKVMGVDLIEMATKAMIGKPFEAYPPVAIPQRYVGIKVPQFSFSRLSGADPVLGVEMASTGEVACFGRDRYEAYLKALISTGFKLPEKNILVSMGSFKDKVEMLPSITKLHKMGFNLFATAGTADFLREHGIPVKYLELLAGDGEDLKSEYSLTQHLANNLIDLYINLPSSNKFRRPANYMSKGYRTRRMAVDYQTPLVTNVKNAKILIEAMSRRYDMSVQPIDFQTSHRTISLPGLINIAAFVPGIAEKDSTDFQAVTKASIAAGFSMIRVMPVGINSFVTDAQALKLAQLNSQKGSYCDYNFSVTATATNADQVDLITSEVGSLFIPFNHLAGNINKVATVTTHFASWPSNKPIMTDAKGTDLASILLLASLHNRNVHVMSVTSQEDIKLIALSKEKGLRVTCDVSIYSLFVSQETFPQSCHLPTKKAQESLWEHLSTIDVFSVGSLPYETAGKEASPTVGLADALPILLTAVAEGRLTIDDIIKRLYENPKRIFELHDQPETFVEIEVDRPYIFGSNGIWSPFAGKTLRGSIQRVNFQGKTACLDNEILSDAPKGTDMSSHTLAPPQSPSGKELSPRSPMAVGSIGRRLSFTTTPQARPSPLKQADSLATADELGPPLYATPSTGRTPSLQELLSRSTFRHKHILSVNQFNRTDLHLLFTVAQEMRLGVQRQGVLDILKGRVLCTLFYEPSTRTSASFDTAMQRLGGRTVPIATQHSSAQKGETLQDTIRTLACYSDAVVLRHPEESSAPTAAKFSPVPIINGGNGSQEHPTQAFLDLFTIREELGTVSGITVTFTGDLRHGRTVHSLIKLLQFYQVRVQLVSPKPLSLPDDIRQQVVRSGQLIVETNELTPEIVARSDVLYCTRVQKERFADQEEYERLKNSFVIDNAIMKHAKSQMVVMHPLPRNAEIDEEVDFDQRAAYFRQFSGASQVHGMVNRLRCPRWHMPVFPTTSVRRLSAQNSPPTIKIKNATFYRHYPTTEGVQRDNPPLYPNLSFELSSSNHGARQADGTGRPQDQPFWAVIGSSDRSSFLEILCGRHICIPPTARAYPLLATEEISSKDPRLRYPGHAIRYIGFDGDAKRDAGGVRGSYLSARYESRREETDFTVLQFLRGQTSLNPLEGMEGVSYEFDQLLHQVIADLGLQNLLEMPLSNLSNGQTRRARIAKALLDKPEVLLLDDPFMGLDPPTVKALSPLLYNISLRGSPQLVLSLRPQDAVPGWITHLIILNQNHTVAIQGKKSDVLNQLDIWKAVVHRKLTPKSSVQSSKPRLLPRAGSEENQYAAYSAQDRRKYDQAEALLTKGRFESEIALLHDLEIMSRGPGPELKRVTKYGEPIVEMDGVRVSYGDKTVLGGWDQMIDGEKKEGLYWEVRRGQRWGVFGLNGSGKTTLLSLITSDHPQAYSLPLRLFGQSRLPEAGKPGISLFDLQSRIGHSSPEIHAFFPRSLSIRSSIESAWADTFLSRPKLNQERKLDVVSALKFFEADLHPEFCPEISWPATSANNEGDDLSILWADKTLFSSLDVSQQRLVLFLRSVIHKPDLIVLDEAFSGMPKSLRDKCLHFLEVGETLEESTGSRRISDFNVWHLPFLQPGTIHKARHRGLTASQALIVISHIKEELPDVISHWMRLPTMLENDRGLAGRISTGASSSGFRICALKENQTISANAWDDIWT